MTSKLQSLSFPWVSSVEIDTASKDSAEVTTLVSTSAEAWEETGNFFLLPRDLKEYLPVNPKSYPLAVMKTGIFKSYYAGKPNPTADSANPADTSFLEKGQGSSRLLVVSNALFASDFFVGYTNSVGNIHLILNALDQMALDPDLINIRSREINNFPIDEAKKTAARLPVVLINMILAPALLLIVGIFIGIRRRKKEATA
jgi:ABC-type uncharacterized transport system involved in gliding motility auxiliary subunit